MAVTHDFECLAHGHFESRSKSPKCPRGCSARFVRLVFLQPVGMVSGRTARADQAIREMAESAGLSDIQTSPSRGGNSVADSIKRKYRNPNADMRPVWADLGGAAPGTVFGDGENALTSMGLGRKYSKDEWQTTKEGKTVHAGRSMLKHQPPAVVQRVRE